MQSIKEITPKIKARAGLLVNDKGIFIILILIITAFTSFGLGRLSKTEGGKTPISIENNNLASISSTLDKTKFSPSPEIGGKYIASKNSDKYHAPWCSGARRIKEENQIWFNNKEEAESAGYTPASNCKGI
ncbi:MAG: hypothetical protein U9P50_02710 [Patescibacteria group bacterium]|nr:hypothetical protein [Patescibacteria group bacterium]